MTSTSSAKRLRTTFLLPEIDDRDDYAKALQESLQQGFPQDIQHMIKEYICADFDASSDEVQHVFDKLLDRSNSTLLPASAKSLKTTILDSNVIPPAVAFSFALKGVSREDTDFSNMIETVMRCYRETGIGMFPERYIEPWAEAVAKVPCDRLAFLVYRGMTSIDADNLLTKATMYRVENYMNCRGEVWVRRLL